MQNTATNAKKITSGEAQLFTLERVGSAGDDVSFQPGQPYEQFIGTVEASPGFYLISGGASGSYGDTAYYGIPIPLIYRVKGGHKRSGICCKLDAYRVSKNQNVLYPAPVSSRTGADNSRI